MIEVLQQHQADFDFDKLYESVIQMSITTIKIFGLLLDLLGVDSERLYQVVSHKTGTHWMLVDNKNLMPSGDCTMMSILTSINPMPPADDYPPTTWDY